MKCFTDSVMLNILNISLKKHLCLKKNNKNNRKIHTKLLAKVTSGSGIRGKSGFYFASFCTI